MKRTARAIAAALVLAVPVSAVAVSPEDFEPSEGLVRMAGSIFQHEACSLTLLHPDMTIESALVQGSLRAENMALLTSDTVTSRLDEWNDSQTGCIFEMTKFRIAFEEELRSSLSGGWLK